MKSVNFQELYRKTYSDLGVGLKNSDALDDSAIRTVEEKLQVKIPPALRDYYLVAGNEQRLNKVFNRLLPLDDLEIHDGKLVFMVENQRVVAWGADLKDEEADPGVFQNPIVKGKLKTWYSEGAFCSQFLIFCVYLQAAYGGGLAHLGSAPATPEALKQLDENWNFIGEIGGMRAYGKPNCALCMAKFPNFFTKETELRLCAGASDKKSLDQAAAELKTEWES